MEGLWREMDDTHPFIEGRGIWDDCGVGKSMATPSQHYRIERERKPQSCKTATPKQHIFTDVTYARFPELERVQRCGR